MLPDMPLLVIPFRGQIQKTLKAELTVVSFFSRVDPFVDFEGLVQSEGLVAVLTDELLHAQVDALMLLEVAVHGEAPAAGLALSSAALIPSAGAFCPQTLQRRASSGPLSQVEVTRAKFQKAASWASLVWKESACQCRRHMFES